MRIFRHMPLNLETFLVNLRFIRRKALRLLAPYLCPLAGGI